VLQAAETDVLQSIAAADLIVVQNSTLALEAALLGKPVITADFTGMPQVVPYAAARDRPRRARPRGCHQSGRGRHGGIVSDAHWRTEVHVMVSSSSWAPPMGDRRSVPPN
jgi:CDP-glycerol glycerophosphotransferase (TagB/SpsB family)